MQRRPDYIELSVKTDEAGWLFNQSVTLLFFPTGSVEDEHRQWDQEESWQAAATF